MRTLIMKFGGSAVGMTTGLTQVLSIVLTERERWERLMLVVSALDGVTDALIEAAHLAEMSNRRGYRRIVATLRTRHLALIDQLPLGTTERNALQADIDRLLFDMLDLCQHIADQQDTKVAAETVDTIIGVGERLSARIVAALLRQNLLRGVAIDATDLIITDEDATPDIPVIRERINRQLLPMLDRQIIPVITGFIGSTIAGKPTTLGRGGSDYTASILGVCTNADEVWIWTDVDGMMSADPRDIAHARVIHAMTYEEAAELAYFGARILHPRMIGPLRERQIPLRVRNVFKPQGIGTLICDAPLNGSGGIKAVTAIPGLAFTAPHSGSLSRITTLIDDLLFELTRTHADVMISSQSSAQSFAAFIIPTSAGPYASHNVQTALKDQLNGDSWQVRPVNIVTAIGLWINEVQLMTADILRHLTGIPILALAQGPSQCSISVVVDPVFSEQAVQQIHSLIVSETTP